MAAFMEKGKFLLAARKFHCGTHIEYIISDNADNFSTIIGQGGFGTVYKAQFTDGFIAAVKRMNKVSEQAEDEFCREMELLGRLHHHHLVGQNFLTLLPWKSKRTNNILSRFLIYEFMEKGSVKDHLHSAGGTTLSWRTRIQIAIDVANALEYLHFYCDPPLCHRDIKSSNILLDENFVAKVADFGLAHASRSGAISFEPVNTGCSPMVAQYSKSLVFEFPDGSGI